MAIRERKKVKLGKYPTILTFPPGAAILLFAYVFCIVLSCIKIESFVLLATIPIPFIYSLQQNKTKDKAFFYKRRKTEYQNFRTDLFVKKIENRYEISQRQKI